MITRRCCKIDSHADFRISLETVETVKAAPQHLAEVCFKAPGKKKHKIINKEMGKKLYIVSGDLTVT